MVSLCFGREGRYLGELWTEGGAYARWVPSATGGGAIDRNMKLWRAGGLPLLQSTGRAAPDGSKEHVTYRSAVPADSKDFGEAVRSWGARHGITLLDLDPRRLPFWKTLLRLPMQPVERVALLLGIRTASEEVLRTYADLLQELERAGTAARDSFRAHLVSPRPRV